MGDTVHIRGREWVFSTLWAASTTRDASSSTSTGGRKCFVRIPVTFVFRNGLPFKAVQSSGDGSVERLIMETADYKRPHLDASALLKCMRTNLVEFQSRSKYVSEFICTVLYADEEKEDLQLTALDVLLGNAIWRKQVAVVQGYVPSTVPIVRGQYSTIKTVRSMLGAESEETANQLTLVLAKFTELAYNSSDLVDVNQAHASASIRTMDAVFARDVSGQLVFLYTTALQVLYAGARTSNRAIKTERTAQLTTAADSVCAELLALLKHARLRGLSNKESFHHFDKGSGFVDADALVDGLARLGVGVVLPVAEIIVERIGGLGSVFITLSDFERFLSDPRDQRVIDYAGDPYLAAEMHYLPGATGLRPDLATKAEARSSSVKRQLRVLSPSRASSTSIPMALDEGHVLSADMDVGQLHGKQALPLPEEAYQHGLNSEAKTKFKLHLRRHRVAFKELSRVQSKDENLKQHQSNPSLNLRLRDMEATSSTLVQATSDTSSADELLHIKGGSVMSFRVVTSGSKTTSEGMPDSLKYRNYLLEREASFTKTEDGGGSNRSNPNFTIVLVPDLFMTLDTLHASFQQIFTKYACATLVLVGLVGLPNTTWQSGTLLDAAYHATCMSALLTHLHSAGRLSRHPNDPLFLMGFGTGAYFVSYFCTEKLPHMANIYTHVRCLVLVNGFVRLDKAMRRVLQELSDALDGAGSTELNELLCSLHFSDDHLNTRGRERVLKEFWRSRRGLGVETKDSTGKLTENFTGVRSILTGLLESSLVGDEAKLLAAFTKPLILVHSTENVFVHPRVIDAMSSKELIPETRFLVDTVSDLQTGGICVQWLKAGHEILQERNPYFLSLVGLLATSCSTVSMTAWGASPAFVYGEGEVVGYDGAAQYDNADMDSLVNEDEGGDSGRGNREEYDSDEDEELEVHLPVTTSGPREVVVEIDAEADERLARKQQRMERQKKAQRAADLEFAYELMRNEARAQRERDETLVMEREDIRSKLAGDYENYCEFVEQSADNAHEVSAEMQRLRRAEAIRQVEENMAAKRAARIEERRRKAADLLHDIESESMLLSGEQNGGYDVTDKRNVLTFIEATRRLLGDYLECRQKAVQSLKRHQIMSEKMAVFREHSSVMQMDTRKLRRAVRLAETNPALVGGSQSIEVELERLRTNLTHKEQSHFEFAVITKQREAQLKAATVNFQRFKLKVKELEQRLTGRLTEMHDMDTKLSGLLKLRRSDRDQLTQQRGGLTYKMNTLRHRKDSLSKELERAGKCTSHFFDTDMWIEGVLQRCVTKDLKRHLRRELELTDEALVGVEAELSVVRASVLECSERMKKFERDSERISLVWTVFSKYFSQLKLIPIKVMADRLAQSYVAAEAKETDSVRDREADAKSVGDNHISRIRLKELEHRTDDEKKIIAIDSLLHVEHYIDITTREAEEMQLDELYSSDLSRGDLDRILRLPEKVSLALPFLHTKAEIEAHRLINRFYRDRTEEFFERLDYLGESAGFDAANTSSGGGALFTAEDLQVAEGVHAMLLRESRRDRLRTCGLIDGLSERDKQWIAVDRILSPEIYSDDEVDDEQAKALSSLFMLTTNLLSGKISGVKSRLSRPGTAAELLLQRQVGDKYDYLRDAFANGEEVFETSAWVCPFDRETILSLRKKVLSEDASVDEKLVQSLLNDFYVDEEESILGHERLTLMSAIVRDISKVSQKLNNEAAVVSEAGEDAAVCDDEALVKVEVDDTSAVRRLWGSWEQVHPASASPDAQTHAFKRSAYSASRDHPAAYGVRSDPVSFKDRLVKIPHPPNENLGAIGLSILESSQSAGEFEYAQNDPNSEWYIVNSLDELAAKDKQTLGDRIVIVVKPDTTNLFDVASASLLSRQSRSHYFTVKDSDSLRVLDLTITIVFQGTFGDRGYKLGRLAASLFRLPDDDDRSTSPLPRPVGYTPYDLVVPNSPNALGRIVIVHRPRVKPLKPGSYQIVIGAASYTKYSIEVACKAACAALPLVDEEVEVAKKMQSRLPVCLRELEDLVMSLRLAERKLHLCDKMIAAADAESKRTQRRIRTVATALEVDDEEMIMREDERRELEREISILEIEFSEWVAIFGSRCKEKASIKEGISLMHASQLKKQEEKAALKDKLYKYKNILPLCVDLLRSVREATNVAAALNSTQAFQALSDASLEEDLSLSHLTPAQQVRNRYRLKGWRALSIEEQQFTILDMELNSYNYDWLREQEEEENHKRVSAGKRPKKKKIAAIVEAVRFSRVEIEYLLSRPYAMLSRKESIARKLLQKFHDKKDLVKQKQAESAYGFDSHLAERVRSKLYQTYSKEEKEWASIDRILHPEVWKSYAHGIVDTEAVSKSTRKAFIAQESQGSSQAMDNLSTIGKILGVAEDMGSRASLFYVDGKVDVRAAVESTQKALVQASDSTRPWQCSLSADEITLIWSSTKDSLKSEEEVFIFKLLQKYNGTYWLNHNNEREPKSDARGLKFNAARNAISRDPDTRCHNLLREIDRASVSKLKLLDSDQLHSNNQRFPPEILRLQLEGALDRALTEQILERERDERDKGLTDSEAEDADDGASDDSKDAPRTNLAIDAAQKREQKRTARRVQRRQELKTEDFATEVVRTTNLLMSRKTVTALQLEDAKILREMGAVGLCLACRSKGCQWEEMVDVESIKRRMEDLRLEIERVMYDKETAVLTSMVALSSQLGGNTKFRRKDLMSELSSEYGDLERRLRLNYIDKELHYCFATREAFVEVTHLHGYATMLSTVNARTALTLARSRLIAQTTVREVIDDILDWMLEGWQFGERQSTYQVMGYVPSIKKDGLILAGQDQIKAVGASVHKMRYRAEMKKKGTLLPLFAPGSSKDKAMGIEDDAKARGEERLVAKAGSDHEKILNETESTLRFGLFMITLMYFRAMAYLSREQKSWSGKGDDMQSSKAAAMTQERMRMLEETNNVSARKRRLDAIMLRCKVGDQRRKEREEGERKESLMRLQAVVRRQKLEVDCVGCIQKVYRGHLCRKAVRRWALKKAELAAMFAVLNATAAFIQRIWRGYLGRVATVQKRQEMAHFIALMRQQEAEDDEFIYWESHPWSKFKRDLRAWTEKVGVVKKKTVQGGDPLAHHLNDDIHDIDE